MDKQISFDLVKIDLGTPILEQNQTSLAINRNRPFVITTNFSDTEIKVGEADFFLKLIEQNSSHQAVLYYGLSAFLAAARSITLYLQAEGGKQEGFDEWYENVQRELKNDVLAKYIKDTRDKALHARYSNIKTVFDVPLYKDGEKWVHRPDDEVYAGFSFIDYIMENGVEKCHVFLEKMKAFITDAKDRGFLPSENARGVSLQATDIGRNRAFKPKDRA